MVKKWKLPLPVMEAETSYAIPEGKEWLYEPKWDGFRCLVLKLKGKVTLQSKAGKDLTRYFPEIVKEVQTLALSDFILDGELVIQVGEEPSFDWLLQRIHPSETRVRNLAASYPAIYRVFDILALGKDRLLEKPLKERRSSLERFAAKYFLKGQRIQLSPATTSIQKARKWLSGDLKRLDGIMAKKIDLPYWTIDRRGMIKIKRLKTADCVVGGIRSGKRGDIASLLLGLYDKAGLLNHVGFTSSFGDKERRELGSVLPLIREGEGFTGKKPGGPSRWAPKSLTEWTPVDPKVVVEVQYDHVSDLRFRHGTKFLRWRPDKEPQSCTYDQIA